MGVSIDGEPVRVTTSASSTFDGKTGRWTATDYRHDGSIARQSIRSFRVGWRSKLFNFYRQAWEAVRYR